MAISQGRNALGQVLPRPIRSPWDCVDPERQVFRALCQSPKTIQEIELWGKFNGSTQRLRQQCVLRCIHRLKARGWAEKTSRKRVAGVQDTPCSVWRLTTAGERWRG